MSEWTISELAKSMGVTPRTIRYYVEIGLLPPPRGAGSAAKYTQEHETRLRAIRHLQNDARLSLDEIREELARMSPEQTAGLAEDAPAPDSSAADYISRLRTRIQATPSPDRGQPSLRALAISPWPPAPGSGPAALGRSAKPGDSYVGEPWIRIPLAEDVELHVRKRGSRHDPRISRLIDAAHRILKEDQD